MSHRIRLHLIALIVVLIFCDSHEKQIDDESLSSNQTTEYVAIEQNLIDSDDDTKRPSTIGFDINTTKLGKKDVDLQIILQQRNERKVDE